MLLEAKQQQEQYPVGTNRHKRPGRKSWRDLRGTSALKSYCAYFRFRKPHAYPGQDTCSGKKKPKKTKNFNLFLIFMFSANKEIIKAKNGMAKYRKSDSRDAICKDLENSFFFFF